MQVLYRPSAHADLDAIHDHIASDNPDAARRVIAHIRHSIDRLTTFPRSGRTGIVPDTFELVVPRSRYVAVFQFVGDHIEVVGVFDGARDRT